MTAKQDNPHDSLFRKIMSNPAAAAGEFRAVLPEWLVALIDWEGMELAPSRYVLPNLRNRDSDILFKTTVAGRDGYIHLLLEHQSTPDKHMPLRVLEYMIGTWTQHPISKVSETNARDLGRLVDQLGPLAKEVAMTTAEQLRAEGQTKGQAKLILRQLTVKFGPLAAEVADRVQAGNAAELEMWAERVVTATSLDEFFA